MRASSSSAEDQAVSALPAKAAGSTDAREWETRGDAAAVAGSYATAALAYLVAWELHPENRLACKLSDVALRQGDHVNAARWLLRSSDLTGIDPATLTSMNRLFPAAYLNVGGGPRFCYPFWRNLDSAKGPLNLAPYRFDDLVPFPAETGQFRIVYSSHCLEHLSDATVDHVLAECARVLDGDGCLVLKLPDFDKLLSDRRRGQLIGDYNLDVAVTPTWRNRGIANTLDRQVAYIFCGFYNAAYGDLFGAYNVTAAGAYNGTACLNDDQISSLLSSSSPHAIASMLREHVLAHETDFTFNHQNAWSRSELVEVVTAAGFVLLSTDRDMICDHFERVIPAVRAMDDISQYSLFAKR